MHPFSLLFCILPSSLLYSLSLFVSPCQCQTEKISTFRNPILNEGQLEPQILKHNGFYYLPIIQNSNAIVILKSSILSNFRDAERRVVYISRENSSLHSVPELYFLFGKFYIYFSVREYEPAVTVQLYVIRCYDEWSPMGDWTSERKLLAAGTIHANEATILQYNNSKELYLTWHNRNENGTYDLYIAKMQDPMTIIPPWTLLRRPTMDWEWNGILTPSFIQHKGRTFLTFTARHLENLALSCFGIMGIDGGKNPLIPYNWWDDVKHCVFSENEAEDVFESWGPSFVRSPDDSELWMVYSAKESNGPRNIRIQKVEFEANSIKFPAALGLQKDIPVPSGE